MSDPSRDPDLFRSIVLGGVPSPGVVTLSGHDREQSWDVKESKNQSGASTTYQGEKVAKFKASFHLIYDPITGQDDFLEWEAFQLIVEAMTAGAKPFALPVYHPDLARQRITEVCGAKVGGIVYDNKGGGTVEVEFIEYKPPKKKGGTATAKPKPGEVLAKGIGDAATDQLVAVLKQNDPISQANAELDSLLKEAQSP